MCSDSPTTRSRGENGQFAPRKGRTEQETRRAALQIGREKRYLSLNRGTSDDVFERLLDSVFIPDRCRKRFIPSTSKRGPLRTMVKRLFRKKFIVSVNRQSFLTRVRYFGGARNKKAENVPKMKIRAADDPSGKYVEKRVYKHRRLPELSLQSAERARVRDWILFALSKNALVVTDEDEAYEIIRDVVQTHHVIDGQSAYDGYPLLGGADAEETQSPPSDSALEGHRSVDRQDTTEQRTPTCDPSQRGEQNTLTGQASSSEVQETSPSPIQAVVPMHHTENDNSYLQMTDMVIKTAQSDDLFLFLCKVEDNRSNSLVGLIAARLLEKLRDFNFRTSALVMDVLVYAYGSHFGTSNAREHAARKQRIRLNVHLLKLTRSVLGKTPYERMEWRAATTVTDRVNTIERNAQLGGLWSQQ